MNHEKIAIDNYKRFSFIEGNEYIATENGLKTILRLVSDFNVRSVLEVGLGIGSISDTIFKYAQARKTEIFYTGTEANAYCLEALKKNVERYDQIHLFESLDQVSQDRKYDLIIVDGSDDSFKSIAAFIKPDTVIFVEGWRGSQVSQIREIFPDSVHVEIISPDKNPAYGPFPAESWGGGGQLIFTSPTFFRKMYWFKERVATFFKRRLRKFKK